MICLRTKAILNTEHLQSNDFIRAIWSPRPFISAGGFTRDLAIEAADTKGELIAFGRHFIANARNFSLRHTAFPDFSFITA